MLRRRIEEATRTFKGEHHQYCHPPPPCWNLKLTTTPFINQDPILLLVTTTEEEEIWAWKAATIPPFDRYKRGSNPPIWACEVFWLVGCKVSTYVWSLLSLLSAYFWLSTCLTFNMIIIFFWLNILVIYITISRYIVVAAIISSVLYLYYFSVIFRWNPQIFAPWRHSWNGFSKLHL